MKRYRIIEHSENGTTTYRVQERIYLIWFDMKLRVRGQDGPFYYEGTVHVPYEFNSKERAERFIQHDIPEMKRTRNKNKCSRRVVDEVEYPDR